MSHHRISDVDALVDQSFSDLAAALREELQGVSESLEYRVGALADFGRALMKKGTAVIKKDCPATTKMKRGLDLMMKKTTKRPRKSLRSSNTMGRSRCWRRPSKRSETHSPEATLSWS